VSELATSRKTCTHHNIHLVTSLENATEFDVSQG
jgi:hypothetical protein